MTEDSALHSILEDARRELFDTTMRNRLINTSRSRTRSSRLEIVDEVSDEVFRRLVTEGKAMSFLPVPDEGQAEDGGDEEKGLLFQPEDDDLDENGLAARHIDDKLQTGLTSDRLQKRLLKHFYDARTYQEEQGVNILYLALGFLKWYEDDNSDRERFAPLLLVPVGLDRQSATSRFNIRYAEDDINTNLSLQARLKSDFGIELLLRRGYGCTWAASVGGAAERSCVVVLLVLEVPDVSGSGTRQVARGPKAGKPSSHSIYPGRGVPG